MTLIVTKPGEEDSRNFTRGLFRSQSVMINKRKRRKKVNVAAEENLLVKGLNHRENSPRKERATFDDSNP